MQNKFGTYSLDVVRRIALLAFYFFGFIVFLPIVFSLILIKLDLVNDLLFMVFVYLTSVVVAVLIARPLFQSERKFSWGDVFRYLIIGICLLFLANIVIGQLIEILFSLTTSENQQGIYNMLDISNYGENVSFLIPFVPYLAFITLVILAPILEEIVFRGVIFRWLRETQGFVLSAVVSGALFGFIHVFDSLLSGNFVDLVYIVLYGVMGLVFSKMYEETGSIYGPIILHACYNAIPTLTLILS
ncbi:CPBP family intramembrane glutamic endopeptidase [Breznakia pachnodae]|uniref:Membrane protease YdiL (CAAX protease family) n=1 Tax=Breznakia pachnodae TaxID=265178 RepID=A0ABU0E849_9FIRM|nr:type II CAAX endopeptidase family protein [Breznakia pachnodae]MDQ0362996.1 membrane protease YdiL (CAAX protease family) [Breznakia pachnodae]